MTPVTNILTSLSGAIPKWQPALWEDYLAWWDNLHVDQNVRLFFNEGYLWIDLGIDTLRSKDTEILE